MAKTWHNKTVQIIFLHWTSAQLIPFLYFISIEDLFWHLTFRQETFRHGHFITGTFRHEDISALEHFSTWIFRHIYILAQTFWHRCPCAKMSMCWNILVPKCLIPMPKCSRAEMSLCGKVPVMKCPCRNVSCRNVRCRNKPKPIRNGWILNFSNFKFRVPTSIFVDHCNSPGIRASG